MLRVGNRRNVLISSIRVEPRILGRATIWYIDGLGSHELDIPAIQCQNVSCSITVMNVALSEGLGAFDGRPKEPVPFSTIIMHD